MAEKLNKPEPKLRFEQQPNGTLVVKAGVEAEVRAALTYNLPFTVETGFKVREARSGTLTAVARSEAEVAAAVLSGLPYSLPAPRR